MSDFFEVYILIIENYINIYIIYKMYFCSFPSLACLEKLWRFFTASQSVFASHDEQFSMH